MRGVALEAILAVVLIFTFVPWLSSGVVPTNAPLTERIKGEAGVLVDEVQEGVRRGAEAIDQALPQEE